MGVRGTLNQTGHFRENLWGKSWFNRIQIIIRNWPGGWSGKRREGPSKQRLAHAGRRREYSVSREFQVVGYAEIYSSYYVWGPGY